MRKPTTAPMATRSSTKPPMRKTVRRLLAEISSSMRCQRCAWGVPRRGSELHLRNLARRVLRLEVLLLLEVADAGDDDRREHLQLRVIGEHRVVVELPCVGDAAFGGRQLLLQCEEVLIRLEV